ncbi:hypothetical protein C7T94_19075 [Pedobacter yulinensis]|uniref:Uncharacterized protein n=1 Tax=Pedobacter yulinensis TaxID=2126353 RepID=A0A2T3HGL1_9SPHI|nr:DUF5362 family protein [Pedobacter yulinensis]PST81575.1 hypothetical protein C7T94_19075 [Pedobacter yulinensis]
MNEFEPETEQNPQLIVTEDMRSNLYEIGRWSRFLAVIGFVLTFFMVVGAFGVSALINSDAAVAAQLGPLAQLGSAGIMVLYLLIGLLFFYPSLLLFKYSSASAEGVLYGNQESLDLAVSRLKSLFKFWGITTMVGIVLYVLSLVSVMFMGGR